MSLSGQSRLHWCESGLSAAAADSIDELGV